MTLSLFRDVLRVDMPPGAASAVVMTSCTALELLALSGSIVGCNMAVLH